MFRKSCFISIDKGGVENAVIIDNYIVSCCGVCILLVILTISAVTWYPNSE